MGWTSTTREPKMYTDLEWYRMEWGKHEDGGERVLAAATVHMSTCYIAYRTKDNKVCCVTVMQRWNKSEQYNFSWKEVEEGSGPYTCECPKRILDMLSPLEELYTPRTDGTEGSYEWAKRWREACYTRLEKHKAVKLSVGTAFVFTEPVRFGSSYMVKGGIITEIRGSRIYFGSTPGGRSSYRMSREQFVRLQGGLYNNLDAWKEAMESVAEKVE